MKKRIIEWKSGNSTICRGFVFGNYSHSAVDFDTLINQVGIDFPNVERNEIEIGTVRESGYMKGFAMVSFLLPAGTRREDYDQWDRFDFNW